MATARLSGDVLVTWPDYDADAAALGGALIGAGHRLRLAPKRGARSPGEMRALVTSAVAAIVSTDPLDAEVFAASPGLRVVARVGVGTDSIDLVAATAHGVVVTVTPGANESTVADHTVALMLAVLRRVCACDADVRAGGWNRTGAHTPSLLSGATVGLIGYGRIGRLVARRLSGFDTRIVFCDPVAQDDGGATKVDLATLMAESDVVSVHTPLTSESRGLIGTAELAASRRGAVLINTSRGDVVDEAALVAALRSGRLRGAGIDVFAHEPPGGSSLLELPNVVLSPHIAGLSDRSVAEMTRRATASVVDVLAGRRPPDVANPGVLDDLGLDG